MRASLPLALAVLLLAPAVASAQNSDKIYSGLKIDLREVGRVYDSLYRDRLTNELDVDSMATYDWAKVQIGNQRYRIKTFLPTDVSTTREVVDYSVIPGYRTRITVPRAAFFETTTQDVGAITITQPRDYTIPGLTFELTSHEELINEIERESREATWKESVRQHILLAPTPGETSAGGIKFEIPLPMPKSLESIFGPGEKTSITVRGREEITIAGQTTITKPFIGVEGREDQSLFPSLDMQQKLDVSLTGTIGDKVSIQVDHSSEAIGDEANRVRLAYNGYEDEVIQLIELGSTSLSLPGSQLVSVSTGAQGLFGVKMLAKMGSTDFTMIASKQDSEVSSATFSPTGGTLGQAETRTIRDVDYVKNKYFFFNDPLDGPRPLPREETVEVFQTVTPTELLVDKTIVPLPGWVMPDSTADASQIAANAALLDAGQQPLNAKTEDFRLLTVGEDYEFILDADTEQIIGIEMFESIPNSALKSIGLSYTAENGARFGGTFNSLGIRDPTTGVVPPPNTAGDLLVLRMLKAPDPSPVGPFGSTWGNMIRYIYNLGLTNIDGNSLEIDIEDILNTQRLNSDTPEGSEVKYLKIFGLDQTDRTGNGEPDGLVDLSLGRVDLTNGLLLFPSFEAFAPDTNRVTEWTDTTFQFTGEYEEQYNASKRIYTERLNAVDEQEAHQYVITVSAVSTSKTFRINALNIVEGSERITIGNERLVRGTDYDIDYITGEVTLKEPALAKLTPNASVNIDYQFKGLGGGGSSTLAGISTVSKLGENLRIGTTALYETRATSDDRPRLGEEPSRAVVAGITGSYEHQSRLLTDLANLLPYVDSDAPSTINLDGEVAASFPNPNTKNEAYIEDFEGTEVSDRISLSRRSWYPASLPIDDLGNVKPADSRLGFIWYNIDPERGGVYRRDLNPDLDDRENTLIQSLDIDLDATPTASMDSLGAYAGLMLGFGSGGLDISQGQFLEIWVNDFKPNELDRGGTLHIDLGVIDENFFDPANNEWNDEDKDRDGFAAAFDDTGLDGLFNDEETGHSDTNPDPNGDDIDLSLFPSGRYEKVNGTEANIVYDTEDLDRNGDLTRDNAYFSYEINLGDSAAIDIRRQFADDPDFKAQIAKKGHDQDSWRLYRIKLSDHTVVARGGVEPRFDEIRHLRMWFEDPSEVVRTENGTGKNRLQITEFSIQGNRWEIDGVRTTDGELVDSTITQFAIGTISTKTDPGVYKPPVNPNVQNEVSEKESSLALRYQDLEEGHQVQILKRFLGQGQDLTLYRDLNFWVHTDELRDGVEYYFRLGSNEENYYEIVVPMTSVFYNETGWSRVILKAADITGLKFSGVDSTGFAVDVAEPDRAYPIKLVGSPSLQSVRFLFAGVRNASNPTPQTGEVWINDIYSGDVLRDYDHAERLSANVSLAGGALSVGGNWARTGADYRGLRQKRGAGADNTTLSLNARTDLQYFLPLAGFSLPVTVGYSKNKSLPKFPPNSDTEIVDEAVSDSLRSESNTRSFSTSLSRRSTSKRFLMRYTFDALRPNFSYSESRSVSPQSRDTTTTMSGSVSYSLNWTSGKTLPLLGKNRIRWWLNSLELSSTGTRSAGQGWSYRNGTFVKDPYQYSATLQNRGSARYNPFRSLETSFGMSIDRDAAIPHEWMGVDVGTEVRRSNNARVSFVPPRSWLGISLFEPSVEVQSSYNEDSSPNVRRPDDPEGTRNASAQRSDTGRLRFDIGRHIGNVFRWVGMDVAKPTGQGSGGQNQGGTGLGVPDSTGSPPPRAPAPPDTARTREKPGAGTAARGILRIFTNLRPISANIQHRVSSSYLRIPDRPDLSYRLGIGSGTGIEGARVIGGDSISYDIPDQKRQQLSFNLDSGVQLTEKFDIQGRYTRATTDNDTRTSQSRTLAVTWPDVQAKWDGLGSFPPLRPILAAGTVNVNYKETHQESGPRDAEPVTTNDTFAMSPAIDMTWKNELQTTLSVSYSTTTNETKGAKTFNSTSGASLDFKREFRGGGGIGLFGKKMSWNNNLETTLSLAYTRTSGERTILGGVAEPIPQSTSFRIFPQARYTFSKNINGSAFIDYSRQYTQATEQTTTTVRVGVTAVVTF